MSQPSQVKYLSNLRGKKLDASSNIKVKKVKSKQGDSEEKMEDGNLTGNELGKTGSYNDSNNAIFMLSSSLVPMFPHQANAKPIETFRKSLTHLF